MTREELIKKVALKMDEISSSDDVIVPVDTGDNNPLYTQINNLLNESINDVLMKAPIYRIQNQITTLNTSKPKDIFGGTRKAAEVNIPEDFIRLVSITDTNFQRPIVDLAIEGDDVDKKQHNKFLVAKSAKPVAVIGRSSSGARVITCYSYDASDTPAPSVNYINRYGNNTDTEETGLDGYMIDLVSWVCAGKVFAAQGDINKGKICDDNAAALMI
jgi:hypothetical protein